MGLGFVVGGVVGFNVNPDDFEKRANSGLVASATGLAAGVIANYVYNDDDQLEKANLENEKLKAEMNLFQNSQRVIMDERSGEYKDPETGKKAPGRYSLKYYKVDKLQRIDKNKMIHVDREIEISPIDSGHWRVPKVRGLFLIALIFSGCQWASQNLSKDLPPVMGASLVNAQGIEDFLSQYFNYDFQTFENKQNGLLVLMTEDLRAAREAEIRKLAPKITGTKISQSAKLKLLTQDGPLQFSGDLQVAILESGKVSRFWVHFVIELVEQGQPRKISRFKVEASKSYHGINKNLRFKPGQELEIALPCNLSSATLAAPAQEEWSLQQGNGLKLRMGSAHENKINLSCDSRNFIISAISNESIQDLYFSIDEEWQTLTSAREKTSAPTKPLENIKSSIEKELGFTIKE